MQIGMIGVGLMGHGIAQNLQKHGYRLHVLAHEGNQPLALLLAGGATISTSAAELASQSNTLILYVTGTPEVEAVLLESDGVGPYLQSGDTSSLLFSMANAKKDLSYYAAMADEASAVGNISRAVLKTLTEGLKPGGANALLLELVTLLASRKDGSL